MPLPHTDYLTRILTASVYDVAAETPLDFARNLSARSGNRILLKREDLQPVFSFKIRGAYNKMAKLPPELLQKGVITASAGNHAQGVALAATRMGVRSIVCMPDGAPIMKVESTRRLGAEVRLVKGSYDDAPL